MSCIASEIEQKIIPFSSVSLKDVCYRYRVHYNIHRYIRKSFFPQPISLTCQMFFSFQGPDHLNCLIQVFVLDRVINNILVIWFFIRYICPVRFFPSLTMPYKHSTYILTSILVRSF